MCPVMSVLLLLLSPLLSPGKMMLMMVLQSGCPMSQVSWKAVSLVATPTLYLTPTTQTRGLSL